MFGIFKRLKDEAKLGTLVADVVEVLVLKFGYSITAMDKRALFDLCREFGKEASVFELAMLFLSQYATHRGGVRISVCEA